MTAIIGIYGKSKSGKTSLIEWLIPEMEKRNLSAATVKHTGEEISLDQESKDSWRHRKAGSNLTALASPGGTNYLLEDEKPLKKILEDLKEIEKPDLVFVEGYKEEPIPSIAVGEIEERENTFFRYRGNRREALEAVEKELKLQRIEADLGGLDCGKCGFPNCRSLARQIRDGNKRIEDCPVMENKTVKISVNGKSIGLQVFPQQMIKNTLLGLISSLKGVGEEVERVSLEIDRT